MKKAIVYILEKIGLYDYVTYVYHAHCKKIKWEEYKCSFKYWVRGGVSDGLPLPPMYLRWMVINQTDPDIFLESGKLQFYNLMLPLLERNGFPAKSLGTVLDFGCGCGRIIRCWKDFPSVELWGTDYNPKLIDWCEKNLEFARFQKNGLEPPLDFAENTFDFIYARSIFTHLNEELQGQWLAEIKRILKPGGVLLFTVMGDWYQDQLTPEELTAYSKGEFVIRHSEMTGKNECAVFHPSPYVHKAWQSSGFTILEMVAGGSVNTAWQDTYLASNAEEH